MARGRDTGAWAMSACATRRRGDEKDRIVGQIADTASSEAAVSERVCSAGSHKRSTGARPTSA